LLYNPRIKSDAPRQFSAALGFISLLSLVANSTKIRAPLMRHVVILLIQNQFDPNGN